MSKTDNRLLNVYLVDDLATVHEKCASDEASKLIINKGYLSFPSSDKYVKDLEFTRVYIKPESILFMSINELDRGAMLDVYNRVIFTPSQMTKRYNRVVRKINNKYPVFTEVGTDMLAAFDCREQTMKLTYTDEELLERTIVNGVEAYREIEKLKKEYYATHAKNN